MNRALVSLARFPRPGAVKTRLARSLGPERAARVYEAFLDDLGRSLGRGAAWTFHWAYEPVDSPFPERIAGGVPAFPQGPGDLGARMQAAMENRFAEGYDAVILIGSDLPHLAPETVEGAFLRLEVDPRVVVLGPAEDGGYYLIGARRVPPVFAGMTWSAGDVLARTRERLAEAGLQAELVEESYDVDTEEDLARLFGDLRDRRVTPVPATAEVLDALATERGWS